MIAELDRQGADAVYSLHQFLPQATPAGDSLAGRLGCVIWNYP